MVRWLGFALVAILLVAGFAVALLPRYLETPGMRSWILSQANQYLGPDGQLDVREFHFSWTGPTRLDGLTLRDGRGKVLVETAAATWDRSLWQVLFDRPDYGRLDLGPAKLDISRASDGKVDVYEALGPIVKHPDPLASIAVRIRKGELKLAAPGLEPPVVSQQFDADLTRPPAPAPVAWDVQLTDGAEQGARRLHLDGKLDRWSVVDPANADIQARFEGEHWPLNQSLDGNQLTAEFHGRAEFERHKGVWKSTGAGRLVGVTARLAKLEGRELRLDTLTSDWDVAKNGASWVVSKLDVTAPFGRLRAQPTDTATRAIRLKGELDLAALAALSPDLLGNGRRVDRGHALVDVGAHFGPTMVAGRRPVFRLVDYQTPPPPVPQPPGDDPAPGPAVVPPPAPAAGNPPAVTAAPYEPPVPPPAGPDTMTLEAAVSLPDLQLTVEGGQLELPPLSLDIKASADTSDLDRIYVERLMLNGPWARIEAVGLLEDVRGDRKVELAGQITPDWDQVQARLAELTDPDATIAGGPLYFQADGTLGGVETREDLLDRVALNLRGELQAVNLLGIEAGPAAYGVHSERGRLRFDPIQTSINGGSAVFQPILEARPGGGYDAGLAPGATIEHAAINADVSHRVLAFAVPVLDNATRVQGFLSAVLEEVKVPIGTDLDPAKGAVVEGRIVFEDVEFAPGPLAWSVLSVAAPNADPRIRLEEPVVLDAHEGRVYQRGLAIALGKVARVTMDGSVGFDRTVDLAVAVPLQAERFQNVPVFNRMSQAIRPVIPIRGTLSEPKVDGAALGQAMGRMGLDIANQAAAGGLESLFNLINRPPLTPEEQAARDAAEAERKAIREQQKLERQQREAQKKLERQMRRNRQG